MHQYNLKLRLIFLYTVISVCVFSIAAGISFWEVYEEINDLLGAGHMDIAWEMAEEFVTPWGLGLIALLGIIIAAVTWSFIPVNRLGFSLKKRDANDLSLLDCDGMPTEMMPLLTGMNQLLEKAQKMLDREKSFVSSAAHELKTPLTALKVQLEVAQLGFKNKKEMQDTFQNLECGVDRLSRLVEQLLALSRAELQQKTAFIQHSDSKKTAFGQHFLWPDMLEQVISEYREMAQKNGVTFQTAYTGSGPFLSENPDFVRLMVQNLIRNAAQYSLKNTVVLIDVTETTFCILNRSHPLPDKVFSHLGERFYRPAGQPQTGSGLGLSIVRHIAELYGYSLIIQYNNGFFKASVAPTS